MDIYSKARELANLIGDSEELKLLKKLEVEVSQDKKGTDLTKEYS